jgi:hypothetical protein
VTRRLERDEPHVADVERFAVLPRMERILRFRARAEMDLCPRCGRDFEMTRDEVGVEVR